MPQQCSTAQASNTASASCLEGEIPAFAETSPPRDELFQQWGLPNWLMVKAGTRPQNLRFTNCDL